MTSVLRIRSRSRVDDAAHLGRRVREMAVDGTAQIARRADVPHLVETGRDSAAAAVGDAMDRVAGRRRRRPTLPVPVFLVAGLVALGLCAWWFVRSSRSIAALRAISDEDEAIDDDLGAAVDQAFDAEALSRATDEGMGTAWARADPAPIPVPPEGGPAEAADRAGDLGGSVVVLS